jgi:tetratricopeptide (TPR) repeat protein
MEDQLADDLLEVTVPLLMDVDIELLLDALDSANRLGELRGKSRQEQTAVFRDKAGRELLVAMIEATSGELFDKRIGDECSDLGASLGYQYAALCLGTSFRQGLARDELLDVAEGEPNVALNDFNYLVNHHLAIEEGGLFRVRHRLIAERALDYFREQGQLADVIASLLWVIAARVTEHTPRYGRERQLLVALLSHEFLIRQELTQSQARAVFDEVENLLAWDSHYWLQRGSFEVERGDIHSAKNFLDQARSLAPDDHMVRTEWAYMTIKRAASNPEAADAQARVDEAIEELEEAIRIRGRVDSYAYHVLGSQGLSWARRAPMDTPVRRQFLAHLLGVVKEGAHNHPKNRELAQLLTDVEHDYLLTATVDEIVRPGQSSGAAN